MGFAVTTYSPTGWPPRRRMYRSEPSRLGGKSSGETAHLYVKWSQIHPKVTQLRVSERTNCRRSVVTGETCRRPSQPGGVLVSRRQEVSSHCILWVEEVHLVPSAGRHSLGVPRILEEVDLEEVAGPCRKASSPSLLEGLSTSLRYMGDRFLGCVVTPRYTEGEFAVCFFSAGENERLDVVLFEVWKRQVR